MSLYGTTVPSQRSISSGCSRTASEKEQKITPTSSSLCRKVVATETLYEPVEEGAEEEDKAQVEEPIIEDDEEGDEDLGDEGEEDEDEAEE